MRRLAKISCMTLLLCAFSSIGAHAQNIVFGTLNASLNDGSLAGTTFQIAFSYDADQVADTGESYVQLNSFDFTLLGVAFTRDDIFQGGQVIFQDGVIQDVTASFQVRMPPGAPVQNITFGFGDAMGIAYIDLGGQFGTGSLELAPDSAPTEGSISVSHVEITLPEGRFGRT